jgi:hypothetical protein
MTTHDDDPEEYSPNPLPQKLKPIDWEAEKARFFEYHRLRGSLDIYYTVFAGERPPSRDDKNKNRARDRGGRGR